MRMLLVLVAAAAVGAWFVPQIQEGTESPCRALEQKMRATLPGGSQMARAVAAETVKQLEQMPHGGGCVVGWWQLVLEHGWGPTGGKAR